MAQTSWQDSVDSYRERYVVFLDLLGFKALVEAAEEDKNEHERLQDVLQRLSQTLCINPGFGSRFSYFSDCVIITADPTPEALWDVFRSISTLTSNLLQCDVFVRGALTRGGAFHNDQYAYGTAVSRAAMLEQDEVINPMTLLSPEVAQDVASYHPRFRQRLEEDEQPDVNETPRHFVHYLMEFAEYHRTPALPGKVSRDVDATRIAFYTSRRLLQDKGKVLEKAKWFQRYWNRTVARPDGFPSIEADPSFVEPEGPRTYIVQRLVASGK